MAIFSLLLMIFCLLQFCVPTAKWPLLLSYGERTLCENFKNCKGIVTGIASRIDSDIHEDV